MRSISSDTNLMTGLRVAAILAGLIAFSGCNGESMVPLGQPALIVAHRGASYDAPEHTSAAYDLAIEQGADYIELDVARTKDGVLVVIHDATADRTLRSEEHTSELQSPCNLVCRLLLEKKYQQDTLIQ